MSNRKQLVRMMFLVTFLIFVLIMYSIQLSRNLEINTKINSNDSVFSETVILINHHRAFSVLLHTITIHEDNVFGYSNIFDSLMTFPLKNQDYLALQNKLNKLSAKNNDCNACH